MIHFLIPILAAVAPDPLSVLEQHCIECHSTHAKKGGVILDQFPVQADDLADIIDAVSGPEPSMPKKAKPLSEAEIAALKTWVDGGAVIPEGRVLHDRKVAGRDWWSLQPLAKPAAPELDEPGKTWSRNEIDRFVYAELVKQNLSPSPAAEPATMIRRLTYDLTGLPPTPQEVKDFVARSAQDADAAYSELVERLLDSPQYGEHWARHWLDVVRYGETQGYDKDQPRMNAWPYRDYVIRSFNEDKPYAQFVQEQLAGDVVLPGDPNGIIALGFIAAGPWDWIAHVEVGERKLDGRIAKHMDRDDMVSATFNTFMSTTVECAQCHNHKFDPVTSEDYYRAQAIFAAVDRANRVYDLDPALVEQRLRLETEIADLQGKRRAMDDKLQAAGGPELAELKKRMADLEGGDQLKVAKAAEFGYHSGISKAPDTAKWVQVALGEPVAAREIVLIGAHDDFNGIGAGFGFPVRYKLETADDAAFSQNVRMLADKTAVDSANPGILPVRFPVSSGPIQFVRLTATRLAPRQNDFILAVAELQVIDAEGKNRALGAEVSAPDSIEAPVRWAKANLVDGKFPTGGDEIAIREMASLKERQTALLAKLETPEMRSQKDTLLKDLEAKEKQLAELPAGKMVFAAATQFKAFGQVLPTQGKPREIRLLHRGDIRAPGDVMQPGAPALWDGTGAEFALSATATEADRRLALARYLTAHDNPLTWRSIVNRVWLYHLGRGIVDSPNDFGRMGMPPTHPELLDWLAAWFRDDAKQSIKALDRLIVTSATYRQSSAYDAAKAAIDGGNAYYWRAARRKLTAEEVRDSVLMASGKLNLTMGGPSFQDFVIDKPAHSPHYEYHLHDHNDPKSQRRSIYRMIVRSQTQPFLTTLDCADPSQLVAKRDETTTALQALALMNNPFMEVMAGHFAERVQAETDPVTVAYELAIGRAPDARERQVLGDYAAEFGWSNACRLVFNLNEFVYID